MTDVQCYDAIQAAPKVFGPWTPAGDDGDAYVRPTPWDSPSMVMVKRIMGSWYAYAGRSISLPSAFATYESAMEFVDQVLRREGARLVGGSRPPPQEPDSQRPSVHDRPTVPAPPHDLDVLAARTTRAD